jgi:hypothetical protein
LHKEKKKGSEVTSAVHSFFLFCLLLKQEVLAREGIDKDTLKTFFDKDLLANPLLNPNEEPETAGNLKKKPARELDLNQTPPAEEVEPDAGGGGGE